MLEVRNAEFIDNGTAPEFFANGLQSVEVMGPVCRFILYVERRSMDGDIIREPPFTCIMPIESVGPAIALTLRTLGKAIIIPTIGQAAPVMWAH